MAIYVGTNEVIDSNRKGKFQKLNPGLYSTKPSASTGDFIYDSTENTIKVYTGSEWK